MDVKSIRTPSRSCAMLWVKKLGYYCLIMEKEKADDWILIFDESIETAKETMLRILSIRPSRLTFTCLLVTQDMTTLVVKSKSWTGEAIAAEIAYCKQQPGNIIYATADGSSSLKRVLQLSGIPHVYDVTHAIAVMLSKLYKEEETFVHLTKTMALMRSQLCCSEYAHIMPPNQRSKSRFLNLGIISKCGIKALNILKSNQLNEKEKELLSWVGELETFIMEMQSIISVISKVSVLLKHN